MYSSIQREIFYLICLPNILNFKNKNFSIFTNEFAFILEKKIGETCLHWSTGFFWKGILQWN